MPYIILANSRKNQGEKVVLVDRSRFKDQWWSERIEKAMIFHKISAANVQKSKLRFNNPEVWEYEKGRVRLGQVETRKIYKRPNLKNALNEKLSQWTDDDWYEGIND